MTDISKFDRDIDIVNVENYRRNGLDNPNQKIYRCVLCKTATYLDDSYSRRGHKLICIGCFLGAFKDDAEKLAMWQNDRI